MYKLNSSNIAFETDGKAGAFSAGGAGLKTTDGSDFFRLHLDDDMNRELTVYGKEQTGTVISTENGLDIVYDSLLAEDGRRFNINFTVHIKKGEKGLVFSSTVKNTDDVRVNEVQVPFVDLNRVNSDEREEDILLMPFGLGEKTKNPWETIQKNCHTEYFASDYNEIWKCHSYPFPLSMGWFGVKSGNKFLYLGKHDNGLKTCSLVAGTGPRHTKDRLILTVSNYPAVIKGEEITTGETVLSMFDNWEEGSDFYSSYARQNWYKPSLKPGWVTNTTGFQRIIMKHQYGEIYFKYKDLVNVFKDGLKYGIKLLLVFGWWKGRFDNGYPEYEIDPELGGKEELFKAIDEINSLGGYVSLYGQGVLLDVSADYYKKIGYKISRKDIDLNEYREFYMFSNNGTLLKTFGYKTFASACQATDEWQNKLVEIANMQLEYKTNMIFFDQVGGHIPKVCFDTTHKHKNRIDDESKYRRENLKKIMDLCDREHAFGTENTVDMFSPFVHFHHGHMTGTWFSDRAFPQMFLTTFPEEIISNRLLHDDREDMYIQLNYAFTYGLVFDVSIYRARKTTIRSFPKYGEYVKYLIDKKREYKDYFYGGKRVHGKDIKVPENICFQAYRKADGTGLMYTLWNNSDNCVSFEVSGSKVTLKAQEVTCLETEK